jgi:VIT1/CCC1 family predicted Fe2+/Mn2+ transporter
MPPSRGPAATSSRAAPPARGDVRRWRRHLADERLEASVYRDLAARRSGEERAILLELADAEGRHAAHWERLLEAAGQPGARSRTRPSLRSALLGLLARRFGSVFVLALAQRAETRSPYADDPDATAAMAADEQIHAEVVRGLAERGREQVSGTFRAAVFGANDGLVSNLALVLGIAGSGAGSETVLLTGLAGLLSGALSMGAGEYISVRSQRELLAASTMGAGHVEAYPHLDVDANELALVYRARGMSPEQAQQRAAQQLRTLPAVDPSGAADERHELVGSGLAAALSSFAFFASGAAVPVLPFLLGLSGTAALVVACAAVGGALLLTGATVGMLSGAPPLPRALRQLAVGAGAAAVTYGLGSAFGATLG